VGHPWVQMRLSAFASEESGALPTLVVAAYHPAALAMDGER
jgi:hypothetical protein